ncbi:MULTISPECIES: DUF3149 domain-containing protein [Ramlibacter]|uniref:DUF3149 domain-containing protein n=1 Tax=Ramlibacter aquaticus TaxID=2780094 RepID=A0ABR9SB53_9BURK|nr:MULTISPECIES: DUF3149 domain-containing protein [Ramlibacter]MBE7939322.1 DUF3149 domain-containing protein [Ramlibacter aquaticus]
MKAFNDFLSTDYGLMSLAVLGITIGMAFFFIRYFMSEMKKDKPGP